MALDAMDAAHPRREEAASGTLIRRLLGLSWRYRVACLRVVGLQLVLLAISLSGLGLAGLGIDTIRCAVVPGALPPRWPLGVTPPATWPPLTALGVIAALILLLALLRAGLTYAATMALARLVQQNIVVDLRAQVYDKLQRLSFHFYDARVSGTLINRVTTDVQSVRLFIDQVLIQVIMLTISLGTYLLYMLAIHPLLTVACLANVPLLWGLAVAFSRRVKPLYWRSSELMDSLVWGVAECVQGIHVVRGFAAEAAERRKFARANAAVRDQKRGIFRQFSVFRPPMDFLAQANLAVLIGYGGYLVMRDELALGTGLIVFAGLLQRFSGQVSGIAEIANSVQTSLAGARRVFEILDAPIQIRSPAAPVRLARVAGEVCFEQTAFAYPSGPPVLRDITLTARPGQCVGIVGPTGSGKSTLLSLIPRFYDATAGRVCIDGVPVTELDLDALRRQIGLVFQESFLFSTTVAANIAFGHPQATREQVEHAARVAAVHDFIVSLPQDYDTVLVEGGADLSGGQRQRLAFARAVLLDPPILLLDDPIASVDAHTEQEILASLRRITRRRTTFLVTHRYTALQGADWVVVLDGGRIVEQGPPAALLARRGPFWRAARIQFMEAGEAGAGAPENGRRA
jgi:ATP-binding cassette subfamily B protein